MIVIGAGLSGLLAGALDRTAMLLERQKELPANHHALLRFRERKIGEALNIPFRRVRVTKSIIVEGQERAPSPMVANWYARKVTGSIVDRSILDVAPVDRFIAPLDFIPRLAAMCKGRIELGAQVDDVMLKDLPRPIISTVPLPRLLEMIEGRIDHGRNSRFNSSAITVHKYRVPGADVFQTVYTPHPAQSAYRSTLTSDELAIECIDAERGKSMRTPDLIEVLAAFGLKPQDAEYLSSKVQPMGKILPLPAPERKALLLHITQKHGIFSLGRFATWRQILLDDVYEDFFRIRRMMELNEYDLIKDLVK